jgi:hypothetical protein
MSERKLVLALLVLAVTSCNHAPRPDAAKPEDYALQLPLEPAAGGSLQRLTLPAAALVALKRADLGDVRVFDARNKVVPLALLEDRADEAQHSTSVPVYPVVGPAGALDGSGLSIRIEDNRVARVVTVDSSAPPANSTATPTAVLLDTHALREPANAIALDADIPVGQPITLTLVTSANLKEWEPLAEKVLFRPADGEALLGGGKVALPGVDLHDRYVGISWGGASRVTLKSASVSTSAAAPPARIAVAARTVPLADAHELRFDLPDTARLAAIRLTETGPDGVIPVKLYGRDHVEDPWAPLAAATLRPGTGGNLIELSGPPMASYRLEANSRTAGLSAAPKLELLFEPVELLVALSGMPPYRLTVGQAAASASYLTLTEIAPQVNLAKLAGLPQARLAAPSEPPPLVALQAGAADGAFEPRKLVLWVALLLGTLVLAFAAIRLLRGTAADGDAKDH